MGPPSKRRKHGRMGKGKVLFISFSSPFLPQPTDAFPHLFFFPGRSRIYCIRGGGGGPGRTEREREMREEKRENLKIGGGGRVRNHDFSFPPPSQMECRVYDHPPPLPLTPVTCPRPCQVLLLSCRAGLPVLWTDGTGYSIFLGGGSSFG